MEQHTPMRGIRIEYAYWDSELSKFVHTHTIVHSLQAQDAFLADYDVVYSVSGISDNTLVFANLRMAVEAVYEELDLTGKAESGEHEVVTISPYYLRKGDFVHIREDG